MKKKIALLLVVIMALCLLNACAGFKSDNYLAGAGMTTSSVGGSSSGGYAKTGDFGDEGASYSNGKGGPGQETGASAIAFESGSGGLAEKIIYSAYAGIETIDFDESIKKVYELIESCGAFIESSNITGRNYTQTYYDWQTYRFASFSIRVPSDRLDEMIERLAIIGNVTSTSREAVNITSEFYDTQSRLNAYRTQEERLLSMLSKAETVADMIEIEGRLAEVRYSIESMTTTLRNWQNQVDYSTLSLQISEVEKMTEIKPIQRSYWQQISEGLSDTLTSVGDFFKDLFKWLVINFPVLIILAVIVVLAVIIIRRSIRRKRQKPSLKNSGLASPPNQWNGSFQSGGAIQGQGYGPVQGPIQGANPTQGTIAASEAGGKTEQDAGQGT